MTHWMIKNKIRFLSYGLFCWAMTLLPLGCSLFDNEGDDWVMVIGSKRLSCDALKREMDFIVGGMPVPVKNAEAIKDQLIERVIDYYLIIEYGEKNNISISEHEFQRNLKDIKREYSEDAFRKALLQGYVDPVLWERRLRNQLLVGKVIKQVSEKIGPPSYEEIKIYFQENRDKFRTPEMLRFRQIVCKSKKEAEKLRSRIRAGEDMGKLAKKHSIAPEAENGGEVGWVARGVLDKAMENTLFSMEIGKISPIVKTPFGYHLFEVISRRPAGVKGLPEAIDEIESLLIRQKEEVFYKKWLEKLRSDFKVEVNQDMLKKLKLS
jgi:peptidyl-prolyl cis-trans isomerase C